MYLNRNKKGYGYYAVIKTQTENGELKAYMNFSFKKGTEPLPQELNDNGSYQGELYFRDTTGKERKVFPIVEYWQGNFQIKYMLLDPTNEYVDPEPSWQPPKAQNTYKQGEIGDDDLPFL